MFSLATQAELATSQIKAGARGAGRPLPSSKSYFDLMAVHSIVVPV
jgi:hypothetical protein